jgi:hypothetical protein
MRAARSYLLMVPPLPSAPIPRGPIPRKSEFRPPPVCKIEIPVLQNPAPEFKDFLFCVAKKPGVLLVKAGKQLDACLLVHVCGQRPHLRLCRLVRPRRRTSCAHPARTAAWVLPVVSLWAQHGTINPRSVVAHGSKSTCYRSLPLPSEQAPSFELCERLVDSIGRCHLDACGAQGGVRGALGSA